MSKKKFIYDYARPCVTVDMVVFSEDGYVLLIKRKNNPFKGMWALPGGHVEPNEDIDMAASRELQEETGLDLRLDQLFTIGTPYRDPRGHYITVVYGCKYPAPMDEIYTQHGDDAADLWWIKCGKGRVKFTFDGHARLKFAFDHKEIIKRAQGIFF